MVIEGNKNFYNLPKGVVFMKLKKLVSTILILSILFTFLSLNFGFTASAQTEYTEGYYTYTVKNGEATIIRCDKSISGDVTIPDILGTYTVTTIGCDAFYKCDKIVNLIVPNSITYIGMDAFHRCDSLQSIKLPFIGEKKDSSPFIGYIFNIPYPDEEIPSRENLGIPPSLKKVILSDKCTLIDDEAFINCIYITDVTIPKSVKYIGESAFQGCTNLKDIYYESNEIEWAKINIYMSNKPLYEAKIHYTYSDTECDEHTYLSKDSERCGVCGKERNNENTEKPNNPDISQDSNSAESEPNSFEPKPNNTTSKNENTSSKNNTTNNKDKVNSSNSSQTQSNVKTENSNISEISNNSTASNAKGDEVNKENNSQETENESVKNESTTNNDTADITPENAEHNKDTENNGSLLAIVITVLIVLSLGAVVLFVLYKKGIIILNKK